MPPATFAPGFDLVGRYRIDEVVGVGHTAEVYTAEDLSLHRKVVVKVLLAHLAAYEDVRRAFRDHIVRSATLSHPHLERVFDGGQSSGSIFMVTEYLEGGSLEGVLSSGRRLTPDDTARLGRDVSGALAYAHENDFVLGSMSPSTLLFDDEGRVRVTDLALAGLTGMHQEQLTYDSVRYLSPEQALGEPAQPKSDVYALALILFEAATGASPFEAISPEAMLRTRISTPLPVRPELGTLDMLLAQAAVPDPRLRLDAEQFSNRLSAAVNDSAPLKVEPVRDELPFLAQFPAVEARTSIGFRAPSPDQVAGGARVTPAPPLIFPHAQPSRSLRTNPFEIGPETPARLASAPARHRRSNFDDSSRRRPTRQRQLILLGAAVLVLVLAAAAGAAWKLGLLSSEHAVPSLIHLTLPQASATLQGDGFTLRVSRHVNSVAVAKNEIVSQRPLTGTQAKAGQVITVTISNGARLVHLPAGLVGEDCATATSQLLKLSIAAQCPSSAAVASSTVALGRVVEVVYRKRTNPTAVPPGATLTLVLSSGAVSVTTTSSATTTSTTSTTTTVAPQPLVAVPNVAGLTRAQVTAAMTSAGLYYTTQGPGAGTTWTTAVSSVPAAGTKVKRFSTILINVK